MQVLSVGRKTRIQAIAFSPDGRDLAAVCGDQYVRVWDLATGEVRHSVAPENSCGFDIAYRSAGRLAFVGVELHCWEIAAGRWTTILRGVYWPRRLCVSPDGQLLALADQKTSTDWGGEASLPCRGYLLCRACGEHVFRTACQQAPSAPGRANKLEAPADSEDRERQRGSGSGPRRGR
jgi:hypothetical protein